MHKVSNLLLHWAVTVLVFVKPLGVSYGLSKLNNCRADLFLMTVACPGNDKICSAVLHSVVHSCTDAVKIVSEFHI